LESENGTEGLITAAEKKPDIILLDLGLPDMDGITVTRKLREWSNTPIIILSVREQEEDKVTALDSGANDYLTKPFGISELLARIRVLLRIGQKELEEPVIQIRNLTINFPKRLVTVDNEEVSLTPTEYDLLRLLVQSKGRVITHRQLLCEVWGDAYEYQTHLLQVNISNLRRKIEHDSNIHKFIFTESGIGYRFRFED
jgi:two-component system KDP operon response regulator KdpE